jgi:hypothetical protein
VKDVVTWLVAIMIPLGLITLVVIRKRKQRPSTRFMIWWIAAVTVWGVISINLVPWLIGRVL